MTVNYEVQKKAYEMDLQNIGFNETKCLTINGFNTAIKRIGENHLCGYVEVPDNLTINIHDIECHGGITFNQENVDFFPTNSRYIGFDCAHAGDWLPYFSAIYGIETYKDTGFVLNEIWNIVQQLQELQEGKQ